MKTRKDKFLQVTSIEVSQKSDEYSLSTAYEQDDHGPLCSESCTPFRHSWSYNTMTWALSKKTEKCVCHMGKFNISGTKKRVRIR